MINVPVKIKSKKYSLKMINNVCYYRVEYWEERIKKLWFKGMVNLSNEKS